MLTDLQIKRLKPTDKRRIVAVGDGLSIRIEPSGRKNWIARSGGKTRGLGAYPDISLADARALMGAQPTTFGQVWELWFADQVVGRHKQPANASNLRPLWAGIERRRIDGLKRAELVALIRALRDRAPARAIKALSQLRGVFDFAVGIGILEVSPLYSVPQKYLVGSPKKRSRILTDAEIADLRDMAGQAGAAGGHARFALFCLVPYAVAGRWAVRAVLGLARVGCRSVPM